MNIKLKPCPHCGSTDLQIDWNGVYECHFVRCFNCHMQGPEIYGKNKAAGCWNALPRHLRWTKEPPTEEGWYWFRNLSKPQIVHTSGIKNRKPHPADEWAGPIQEPVK